LRRPQQNACVDVHTGLSRASGDLSTAWADIGHRNTFLAPPEMQPLAPPPSDLRLLSLRSDRPSVRREPRAGLSCSDEVRKHSGGAPLGAFSFSPISASRASVVSEAEACSCARVPVMSEEDFSPGEKVIAFYEAKLSLRGWYNAAILGADQDGGYIVRWEPVRNNTGLPRTSPVDTRKIKRRPDRGSFSGF
jgi:hypothetical protein